METMFEKSSIVVLNKEEIYSVEKEKYFGQMMTQIENKNYYVKKVYVEGLVNELLSGIIAKKVNLKTPNMKIALVTSLNDFYLLSEDFRSEDKIYTNGSLYNPQAYGDSKIYHSISSYEKFLKQTGDVHYKKFLLQLLKLSIYDAYRREKDRTHGNYFFNVKDYEDMVLLDHCDSFNGDDRYFVQNEQFCFKEKSNTIIPYLKKYPELKQMVEILIQLDMGTCLQELEDTYCLKLSNQLKEYYEEEVIGPKKEFTRWLNKM